MRQRSHLPNVQRHAKWHEWDKEHGRNGLQNDMLNESRKYE
jgi:hypothetical protein